MAVRGICFQTIPFLIAADYMCTAFLMDCDTFYLFLFMAKDELLDVL